jgi:hypothetical protein
MTTQTTITNITTLLNTFYITPTQTTLLPLLRLLKTELTNLLPPTPPIYSTTTQKHIKFINQIIKKYPQLFINTQHPNPPQLLNYHFQYITTTNKLYTPTNPLNSHQTQILLNILNNPLYPKPSKNYLNHITYTRPNHNTTFSFIDTITNLNQKHILYNQTLYLNQLPLNNPNLLPPTPTPILIPTIPTTPPTIPTNINPKN